MADRELSENDVFVGVDEQWMSKLGGQTSNQDWLVAIFGPIARIVAS